jgi:hypothetical protein
MGHAEEWPCALITVKQDVRERRLCTERVRAVMYTTTFAWARRNSNVRILLCPEYPGKANKGK